MKLNLIIFIIDDVNFVLNVDVLFGEIQSSHHSVSNQVDTSVQLQT